MFKDIFKFIFQWIKEEGYKILIPFIILIIALGFYFRFTNTKPKEQPKEPSQVTQQVHPQATTAITVVPKEKPTDPDLKVTQKYTANINGKTVEVPLTTPKETIKDNQVIVSQSLDVTSAVKSVLPRWSIGIGVGRYGSETYIPLSITRHYKPAKRSLQFSIKYSIDKGKINGGEIQHLWSF